MLYCSDHCHFRRPKHPINFAAAYADAKFHFDTFRMLGNELIEQAQDAFSESRNMRLAALFMAQAAVYFYHTLYYVYHGLEFDIHDPVVMHERMRTLSTQLMLVLDDNHIENIFTLPRLKSFLVKARYDIGFDVAPQELEMHLQRVEKNGPYHRKLLRLAAGALYRVERTAISGQSSERTRVCGITDNPASPCFVYENTTLPLGTR